MPHKLQNILDKILWGAGVIFTGLVLGIGIQFAIAAIWTGPTSAPPNDNVSAPLNTGANQQLKGNFSSHIGSASLAGVLETFGFKMPTGAQPGYVLTAQDANGQAAWAAGGGGGCYVDYSFRNTPKAIGDDCGGGFKIKKIAGGYGYCTFDNGSNYYFHSRPAGAGCYPGWGEYQFGVAYVCCL